MRRYTIIDLLMFDIPGNYSGNLRDYQNLSREHCIPRKFSLYFFSSLGGSLEDVVQTLYNSWVTGKLHTTNKKVPHIYLETHS